MSASLLATPSSSVEQAGLGGTANMPHQGKTGPSTTYSDPEGATVGRANDNTVCISDQEVSRRHSCISYRDGDFMCRTLAAPTGHTSSWLGHMQDAIR